MKKLLSTAAAVFITLSTYAQGTVDFANDATSIIVNSLTGQAATAAQGIRTALYWAPLSNPDNFTVLLPQPTIVGVPTAGRFVGGTRTTGNATAPGEQARFIVRAWENAFGATYEAAIAAAPQGGRVALRGESPVFLLNTGGGGVPPSSPANLQGTAMSPGFTGLTLIVPEPSTIALGLIGAGSLLLFRRRK